LQNFDLIVFDLDGTIMDSTGLIAWCIQMASFDLGLEPPSDAQAKYIIGLGIQDSMERLFPTLSALQRFEFELRYRHHFTARDHEAPLYPGIRELLLDLRAQQRILAIATGKPRAGLERAFLHTGLKPMFDFSRCGDEGFPKPHPDMLLKLLEFAGVENRRAVMIGDTTHDLEMAANAGVNALAVSYGAHPEPDLTRFPQLACFANVTDLHRWLNQNA
jgi:phosphoglycolate phosphatase